MLLLDRDSTSEPCCCFARLIAAGRKPTNPTTRHTDTNLVVISSLQLIIWKRGASVITRYTLAGAV